MLTVKVALIALVSFTAVTLWACGGDDDGDATVTVIAESTLFEPKNVRIAVGEEVTIALKNRDPSEHDLQVDGLDVEVVAGGATGDEHGGGGAHGDAGMIAVHTEADETSSITFVADKAGTYEFYCTIAGHKEAGMTGTLTVE